MTQPSPLDKQKKGRSIAMDAVELDAFLREQRTCRMATVDAQGRPHVTALWFAWDGEWMWINSVTRSKRWADFSERPRVSALVDAGENYSELQGAELLGDIEIVRDDVDTSHVTPLFSRKYMSGGAYEQDKYHAWVRLKPSKVVSWDFTKLPAERQKRDSM
ncbi:MAG: pyridoxamine 5'-phosphate oxidase family protein [Antricoccus sp.]